MNLDLDNLDKIPFLYTKEIKRSDKINNIDTS